MQIFTLEEKICRHVYLKSNVLSDNVARHAALLCLSLAQIHATKYNQLLIGVMNIHLTFLKFQAALHFKTKRLLLCLVTLCFNRDLDRYQIYGLHLYFVLHWQCLHADHSDRRFLIDSLYFFSREHS